MSKKSLIKKEEIENYKQLLKDIKSLLQTGLSQAYKAVDNIKVQTYWQIGERIVREELENKGRADYGKKIINLLARDIGLEEQTLRHIIRFYRAYPILSAVRRELSWTHYRILIYRLNKVEMPFYENQCIINCWTTRELEKRIKNKEYEKARKKGEIAITLPKQLPSPEEVFKDTYNFDFLELKSKYREEDLKNELLNKLKKFLHELGSGFFVGRREVPLLIGGNYDKVDLELFHAGLMCYVLIEVKIEHFKHSHVSQMYSYINWYKEHKWIQGQRQPIGLIICKTKDEETVHYALGDLKKEIFVAEYKTKLPSEQEIKSRLEE